MRTLLVGPVVYDTSSQQLLLSPPVGILALQAYLETGDEKVEVLDPNLLLSEHESGPLTAEQALKRLEDTIRFLAPDIVGLSTIASSYHLSLDLAARCKAWRPECRIVLGGPQASVTAAATLESFPCVDVVVVGEGEVTLRELVAALRDERDLEQVPGIAYRRARNREVVLTAPRELIADLDILPFRDYRHYEERGALFKLPIEGGRGCPYRCKFCASSGTWQRRFRCFSVDHICDEIRFHLERLASKPLVGFLHDLFTLDTTRLRDFCHRLIGAGTDLQWGCAGRADSLDAQTLTLMKDAGCLGVGFGLESVSPRLLSLLGKEIDITQALSTVRQACRQLPYTQVCFLVGHPSETRAEVEQMVETAIDLMVDGLHSITVNHLVFLPGTAYLDQYRRQLAFDARHIPWPSLYADHHLEMIRTSPELFSSCYLTEEQQDRFHYHEKLKVFLSCLREVTREDQGLLHYLRQPRRSAADYLSRWIEQADLGLISRLRAEQRHGDILALLTSAVS